jgi:O-antigen/teichoic acid export membrane protein
MFHAPLRKHFSFLFLISVEKGIANYFSLVPVMVAGVLLDRETLAYFGVALTFINLPRMTTSAINKVLVVKLPETKGKSGLADVRRAFVTSALWGGLVGFLSVVGLFVVLPFVLIYVYKQYDPWKLAAATLGCCVWMSVIGFAVGTSTVYRMLNRLVTPILVDAFSLAAAAALGYYVLVPKLGLFGCGLFYSLGWTLSQGVGWWLAYRYLKQAEAEERTPRTPQTMPFQPEPESPEP